MAQKNSRNFSFIGQNIKKIRQAKHISQSKFALLFNLARPSIGAYEEGRSEPKIETIIEMAKYFQLSIDAMLTRELTSADILSMGLLNKKLDQAHIGVPCLTKNEVPLIRIEQRVNYIVNHTNKTFIDKLPTFSIPNSKIARIFEQESNALQEEYGIRHGDLLFCERIVPDSEDMFVVVESHCIHTKKLVKEEEDTFYFNEDTSVGSVHKIPKSHVLEIWKIEGVYSKLLQKSSLTQRIEMLEKEIMEIKKVY